MGRASPPHPRTNPSPVVLRPEKAPEPDTLSPRARAVASHGGEARNGECSADPASAGSACRDKARRYSRRGLGEGSLHCPPHPAQNTENSRNELHDLLQSKALNTNAPSKRTISEAQNELVGGANEWAGQARPIHEPTPHPSCSGRRKRRSPTPSPLMGRGALSRLRWDGTAAAVRSAAYSGWFVKSTFPPLSATTWSGVPPTTPSRRGTADWLATM